MVIRLPAPAKLNLYLRVVGRRPDGYHELETLYNNMTRMCSWCTGITSWGVVWGLAMLAASAEVPLDRDQLPPVTQLLETSFPVARLLEFVQSLENPTVQQRLGLSADQVAQLKAVRQQQARQLAVVDEADKKKTEQLTPVLSHLPEPEKTQRVRQRYVELYEQLISLEAQQAAEIRALLNPDQQARYDRWRRASHARLLAEVEQRTTFDPIMSEQVCEQHNGLWGMDPWHTDRPSKCWKKLPDMLQPCHDASDCIGTCQVSWFGARPGMEPGMCSWTLALKCWQIVDGEKVSVCRIEGIVKEVHEMSPADGFDWLTVEWRGRDINVGYGGGRTPCLGGLAGSEWPKIGQRVEVVGRPRWSSFGVLQAFSLDVCAEQEFYIRKLP